MSDTEKQKIGRLGEEAACMFLTKQGFSIVDRNYLRPWGEIDIVAQNKNDLRFIEVKTVTRNSVPIGDNYDPEDNIHPWKRKRLRRIIETYILQKDLSDDIEWQVDTISVYLKPDGEVLKIERLEDVIL